MVGNVGKVLDNLAGKFWTTPTIYYRYKDFMQLQQRDDDDDDDDDTHVRCTVLVGELEGTDYCY
mgnify:CR=1 FL=1